MANNLKGWSKATNQFVGVVSHDLPVFTGTWLSFVSIYYKVLGSAWGVRLLQGTWVCLGSEIIRCGILTS